MGLNIVEVQQATRALNKQKKKTLEPSRKIIPGILVGIDSAGTPAVTGKPNYVWFREYGSQNSTAGGVIPVLNLTVQATVNLPVLVGPGPKEPYQLQVLGTNSDLVQTAVTPGGTNFGVQRHAYTHTLLRGRLNLDYGTDVAWITASNFMDLVCLPTDPPSMQVEVRPGMYIHAGTPQTYRGGLTPDMSALVPTTGHARLVNILIDGNTNTVEVLAGTEFDCQAPFVDTVPYTAVTTITPGRVLIGRVYLHPTMTAIDEVNFLYDAKPLLHTLEDVVSFGTHTPTAGNILVADGTYWQSVGTGTVDAADWGSGTALVGKVLGSDGAGGSEWIDALGTVESIKFGPTLAGEFIIGDDGGVFKLAADNVFGSHDVLAVTLPGAQPAPSYANAGGTGNRAALITITTNVTAATGAVSGLIDGSYAVNYSPLWTSNSGSYWCFDFKVSKLITEIKVYQQAPMNGVWRVDGSDDAGTWTAIGSTFSWTAGVLSTITTVAANTIPYRYYRIIKADVGTAGDPYLYEVEFKIAAAATPAYVGVNTVTPNSTLQVDGSLSTHRRTVTATVYFATNTDCVLLADATGGSQTITLPTPVDCDGRQYTVKRVNSGANTVTVATAAGLIDGVSSKTLTSQYDSITVVSDNANWWIV